MNVSNDSYIDIDVDRLLQEFDNYDFAVIGLYIPVFLLALGANLLFIAIIAKHRYMRRTSNYFLLNLSAADLFVTLFCMPSAMWKAYTTLYSFERYTCKIFAYFECVVVAASILTITAMAMHRYFAITKPLLGLMYPPFNQCGCIIIISCLWFVSMVIFCPILWVYDLMVDEIPIPNKNLTIYFCGEDWNQFFIPRKVLGVIWFVFIFLIPGTIMMFAYSTMGRTLCSNTQFYEDSTSTHQRGKLIRKRKRVACILFLLALIFAACWLPYHVMVLINDLETTTVDEDTAPDKLDQRKLNRYLLLLGHLNSALNPIVYFGLSRKLRNSIKELFCRGACEAQRELTRVTLIKLNTLRSPILQNSRSTSQNTKKIETAQ